MTAGPVSADPVRESAIAVLTDWRAPDAEQDSVRHAVLAFLHGRPDGCQRACAAGHVTASALVIDEPEPRSADPAPPLRALGSTGRALRATDDDIVAAALREATEESGIDGLVIDPDLAAIHVHPVTCSLGVPTRHLDLQFIVRAPRAARPVLSDESLDLRWWPMDGLPAGADPGLSRLCAVARTHQMSLE